MHRRVSVHTTFSIVSATASGSAIGPWVQSQIEAAFVTGFRASAEKVLRVSIFSFSAESDDPVDPRQL
jgi:methyl coenzyme M reductase alpha subunit